MIGLAVVSSSALAGAQWKWRDASGAVQYSDRPPPVGTPEASILSRPATAMRANNKPGADTPASSPSQGFDTPPSVAASKPEDKELEARRRKAEQDKQALVKAEEDKIAKTKAENCARAKSYQRTLADGLRIARTNAKGEREILDDKGRAEETQRTKEAVQANCNQ